MSTESHGAKDLYENFKIKVLAYYGNIQLNLKWLSDSEICTNVQFA